MANMTTEHQTKTGPAVQAEPLDDGGTSYAPLCDIMETDDAFHVYADVPGAKPEDLDITYDDGTVTLIANVAPRQPAGQEYVAQEYGVGPFRRQFAVWVPIDAANIRAELKGGELQLTIPKAASAKTRKVPIVTGG